MTVTVMHFGPLSAGASAKRPYLIVTALLLAAFVVSFDTRIFAIGLPDLRGAFGLGYDQASWLSTAANAPQIFLASGVAWLMTVLGVRRIMIPTSMAYAAVSLAIPLLHSTDLLIGFHIVRGLLLGILIPATIMIIFRNLDPHLWLIGIAIYALRIPLSQSLGVVIVGTYVEHLGWQWLYWQDVILAPLIALLIFFGAPFEALNMKLMKTADWGGMLLLGSSMAMLYVALDQGNRLDWFNSGVIVSLFVAGALLAVCFVINENVVANPWAHGSVILSRNLGLGFGVIIACAFGGVSQAVFVPGFLQTVVGLRPIQMAGLFFESAVLPVFVFIAIATLLLRVLDPRFCMILGFVAMALASMLGVSITSAWYAPSFALIVLLQTFGQAFIFLSAIVYLVTNIDHNRATAASAYIQVLRLGSAELAGSLFSTWITHREQFHSNILGSHVTDALPALRSTLSKLAHVFGASDSSNLAAISVVGAQTRTQAYVLAYSDGFVISFWFALVGLVLVAFMKAAPKGPLTPKAPVLSEEFA